VIHFDHQATLPILPSSVTSKQSCAQDILQAQKVEHFLQQMFHKHQFHIFHCFHILQAQLFTYTCITVPTILGQTSNMKFLAHFFLARKTSSSIPQSL